MYSLETCSEGQTIGTLVHDIYKIYNYYSTNDGSIGTYYHMDITLTISL